MTFMEVDDRSPKSGDSNRRREDVQKIKIEAHSAPNGAHGPIATLRKS